MNQHDAFLAKYGDLWFDRNKDDMGKDGDPVYELLTAGVREIKGPILEIGCANGWRLKALKEKYGSQTVGVDPSKKAIEDGIRAGNADTFFHGTAQTMRFDDGAFDVVILGYCLFLIHPEDWFLVAHNCLRVVSNKGLIVIFDKLSARPVACNYPYELSDGKSLGMYHFDWPSFFCAHPSLVKVTERVRMNGDMESCAILQKQNFGIEGTNDK